MSDVKLKSYELAVAGFFVYGKIKIDGEILSVVFRQTRTFFDAFLRGLGLCCFLNWF